jgi:hypothetical protein
MKNKKFFRINNVHENTYNTVGCLKLAILTQILRLLGVKERGSHCYY